mgnify:CR=1 FL=1
MKLNNIKPLNRLGSYLYMTVQIPLSETTMVQSSMVSSVHSIFWSSMAIWTYFIIPSGKYFLMVSPSIRSSLRIPIWIVRTSLFFTWPWPLSIHIRGVRICPLPLWYGHLFGDICTLILYRARWPPRKIGWDVWVCWASYSNNCGSRYSLQSPLIR